MVGGQTIVIIDAYDDATIENDLNVLAIDITCSIMYFRKRLFYQTKPIRSIITITRIISSK